MTDGAVPHDEYRDEMDMLGINQFLDVVQRELFLPLELFGVSVIEIVEKDQTVPTLELPAFVVHTIDMYEGTVGPIEDNKVRVCVDFRDLNKVSPKDDFSLLHIDLLVDSTASHSMLSFMDEFSRYNQILMAPKDMEKTTFMIEWGTYYYRVMPFGVDHLAALERLFERIQKFKLRLNPKKCTFGVTSGKFFSHMASERGIEVDPDKIKAILDMPVPRTEKEFGALVWATKRLRHYITEYSVYLISRLDPLRYLFDRPTLADHLASLPTIKSGLVDDDFLDEEFVVMTRLSGWRMYFDGAASHSEVQDDLPWFHDIHQFLRFGTYPEAMTSKDQRALCGETLYRQLADGMLLLCLDRASTDRVMREVHAGVCGLHMGRHMLARKIMRTGYFWLTMETDCCQFVQRCPECQMHGDLIHVPPLELHVLTSPWPFSIWGIHIIGKISPKSSNGHEFILVAIDYFTKWVEVASYAKLASARVASFIRNMASNIIDHLHTEKLPFALWAYHTSFCTSIEATPYSLVYGMEVVLPIKTEMGSLRVALKQQISEIEWAHARFDQLNLLDERRLRVMDHVQAYEKKMARAFRRSIKPRPLHKGDLVLSMLRGLIGDPKGSSDLVGVDLMLFKS
ncbi:Transposon Ty3-I Gag-Pol polyprotein [Vitis vinifera]|uniref:Transposon Ty3-I Gag-Pol polyprotein n=1 Tax=Vitis vinifera TaxID=29760 RepID=A0A438FVC2_VITVI|nr:Transposon Ty3-I Gag-Pol polyprotein [Vitis vinifera]